VLLLLPLQALAEPKTLAGDLQQMGVKRQPIQECGRHPLVAGEEGRPVGERRRSPLDEVEWPPAQRLAPYCPRRKRDDAGQQERLFDQEGESSVG
jgi:hypothetical protein